MDKVALITGVNGQDGSYLAEHLIDRGYIVVGLIRRMEARWSPNLEALCKRAAGSFELHVCDLQDRMALLRLMGHFNVTEVYHLAGQTYVPSSIGAPDATIRDTAILAIEVLQAAWLYQSNLGKEVRIYLASSSEMFGNSGGRTSADPMNPCSPYGLAKKIAHDAGAFFSQYRGLFVARGICFNHESPRRGPMFFTKQVVRQVAAVLTGELSKVTLGQADAMRDWGWAPEYVVAMRKLLEAKEPLTTVICTGRSAYTAQFANECMSMAGLDPGQLAFGDPARLRGKLELRELRGDPEEAATKIGWRAEYDWRRVAREMLEAETGKRFPIIN